MFWLFCVVKIEYIPYEVQVTTELAVDDLKIII